MLLNNCLCGPVSYSPMGLVNASPTDYQSWVIGGGGAWHSGRMLKNWSAGCVVCGPDGLLLKDKLGVREFPPSVWCRARGRLHGSSVSQPFSPILIRAFSLLSDV